MLLAWLLQRGFLSELARRWTSWKLDYRKPTSEFDIESLLDDDVGELGTVTLDGQEFGVEPLAAFLSLAQAEVFSNAEFGELEPLWISEIIHGWSHVDQARFTSETGEIFLCHWKFDRAMQCDIAPVLAFFAHLMAPQLVPDCLTYEELLLELEAVVRQEEELPLAAVRARLGGRGVSISLALLQSVLRNEPRFLLRSGADGAFIARSSKRLAGWLLASELLNTGDYLGSVRMGLERGNYWDSTYIPRGDTLRRFFSLHQPHLAWDNLDLLEVALKLKTLSNHIAFIQGLPAATHEFIVRWIERAGVIWRISDSERTLGASLRFDVADMGPGRLMVYGTLQSVRTQGPALVLREMVSEGTQTRGHIHSSRVLTPFHEANLATTPSEVNLLISSQLFYRESGVAHVLDLADALLARRGVARLPYFQKRAAEALITNLPDCYVLHTGTLVCARPPNAESGEAALNSLLARARAILESDNDVGRFAPANISALLRSRRMRARA